MAKKKQTKKHKFKYAEPTTTNVTAPAASGNRPVVAANLAAPVEVLRSVAVAYDLRRVGILAASLIALEIIIWVLFGHTGLGNAVYNFVQI